MIERLYNYAESVQVRVSIPNELNGIRAGVAMIPRGQSEGKLSITLGDDATPGTHKFTVTATSKLGGHEIPNTQEIVLTVEPPAPK